MNSQVLVLIRENIKKFEDGNGTIDDNITPDSNENQPVSRKNSAATAEFFQIFEVVKPNSRTFIEIPLKK